MNREVFFTSIREGLFTEISLTQARRIEVVLDGLIERKVQLRHAAYILATAHHESARFGTLEEYASGAAYEGRKSLGNTQRGDGRRFKGRGFVQITGRRNYTDWSKRLGVDLVGNPEIAEREDVAVRILIEGMLLGTFTGKKLSDYSAYTDMRRVVNGTDKAALIAGYAVGYENALRRAGYAQIQPARPVMPPAGSTGAPRPAPPPPPPPAKTEKQLLQESGGVLGPFFRWLATLFNKGV